MLHLSHLPEEPNDVLLLCRKLEGQDLMVPRHLPTSTIELIGHIMVGTFIFLGSPYNTRCQGRKTSGIKEIDSYVH